MERALKKKLPAEKRGFFPPPRRRKTFGETVVQLSQSEKDQTGFKVHRLRSGIDLSFPFGRKFSLTVEKKRNRQRNWLDT